MADESHSNRNGLIQFTRVVDIMRGENGLIPITVKTLGASQFVAGIEITARLTHEAFQKWQYSVFEKITQRYSILQSEFENKKAREEVRRQTIQTPGGTHPTVNRKIIDEELKKHCITMLTGWQYDGFDAMEYYENDPPKFNLSEAIREGFFIRFFEEAFEWDKITYLFYPYFWGRKTRWEEKLYQQHEDPLFKNFLRAGAARVVVPVSPALTEAILWYVKTGELRIASSMPAVDGDTEYLSIINEVYGQPDDINGGVAEGEPWDITIPTSLVMLNSQKSKLEDIP
jgi:hypothetical protein